MENGVERALKKYVTDGTSAEGQNVPIAEMKLSYIKKDA